MAATLAGCGEKPSGDGPQDVEAAPKMEASKISAVSLPKSSGVSDAESMDAARRAMAEAAEAAGLPEPSSGSPETKDWPDILRKVNGETPAIPVPVREQVARAHAGEILAAFPEGVALINFHGEMLQLKEADLNRLALAVYGLTDPQTSAEARTALLEGARKDPVLSVLLTASGAGEMTPEARLEEALKIADHFAMLQGVLAEPIPMPGFP